MPTVEAEVFVNAPLERVYAISRDIEAFPEFMDDVQEVRILEQTPERQVSRWVGAVKELGRTITWTEEDFWNDKTHLCTFRQIEGDFTSYEGVWSFEKDGDSTRVRLQVTYEFRVPLVGALIQGLLQKKMRQNCESMLEAIKGKAESAE